MLVGDELLRKYVDSSTDFIMAGEHIFGTKNLIVSNINMLLVNSGRFFVKTPCFLSKTSCFLYHN